MPLRSDKLVLTSGVDVDSRLRFEPDPPSIIEFRTLGLKVRVYEKGEGEASRKFPFAVALLSIRGQYPDLWERLKASGVDASEAEPPVSIFEEGTD